MTSPNFPYPYPNNLHKYQTIQVEEGMVLILTFEDFDVQSSRATCDNDHLTIRDGTGEILMEKTCGDSIPSKIRSKTNSVHLIFVTDNFGTRKGWSLTWTKEPRPQDSPSPGAYFWDIYLKLSAVQNVKQILGIGCSLESRPQLENGKVLCEWDGRLPHGSICDLKCNTGFVLDYKDKDTATCLEPTWQMEGRCGEWNWF